MPTANVIRCSSLRARLTISALAIAFIAAPTQLNGEGRTAFLGLPQLPANSRESDAAIDLGRTLFFDARLSASGKVSCATCHIPSQALSDGLRVSRGQDGLEGTRNAPSLINVRFNESFFWDGRRATLEEQALDPFLNPTEHGLANTADLLRRVKGDPSYIKGFFEAYQLAPQQIETVHVARALASFQRTMIAGDSPFDRYYYKSDKSALGESALRGLKIFQGVGQCTKCHTIGEKHALFTDEKFHRLSVGINRIESRLAELTRTLVERRTRGESLHQLIMLDPDFAELGRFAVTLNPVDIGKFRTPSLRNVALTAPYMHDGSVETLEDAVELEIYYRGTDRGYPLIVTVQERDDLVAFMHALTSPHANKWAR